MRLIDGDALISAMIERCRIAEMCQAGDRLSGFIAGIEECIWMTRDIMPAKTPTVNEWISVKERLPETGGEYLAGWYGSDEVVLVRFTNDCFGMRFSLCDPEKEHRPAFYYEDDEWGTCEWEDIECWMQKPVPPEVEG